MKKNKKVIIGILIVLIIVIGVVVAYKVIENSVTNRVDLDFKVDNISSNTVDTENHEKDAKQLLLDIMNNKKSFIDQDNNETLLKNFEIVETQKAEVQKYAFVDFDKDGTQELVIYTTSDYGAYVILHYEEGNVYGYMIEIRSLENLKGDGSFTGSNGASSTEYLRMTFNKNNYDINTEAIYDITNKIYKINNNQVSLEEIKEYVKEWNQKEDVKWNN